MYTKFLPDVILDLYEDIRQVGRADLDWYYYREEQTSTGGSDVTAKGYMKKWGGECDGGCLNSNTVTMYYDDNYLLWLMNPEICPGYSEYTAGQCKREDGTKIYIDNVKELFDASQKFSFMADFGLDTEGSGPRGAAAWLDGDNAGLPFLLSAYANIVSQSYYNKIRAWLQRISNSNTFTNLVRGKIQGYTGQSADEVRDF